MKKRGCLLAVLAFVLFLCSCGKTVEGHDGLIEKAREEIPLADIENMDIAIAGSVDVDGYSLIWFIAGNEYQKQSYFPMEFKIAENQKDKFEFVKAYKAYDCGQDIAAYPWNGYVFLVNNDSCRKIVLDYEDNSREEIDIAGKLPFLYSTDKALKGYYFLDEKGNEIF